MRPSGVALSNGVAAIAIAAFLVLSQLLAPPAYVKEARLSCSASGLSMQFEDMKACTNSPDYRPGCGCGPMTNPWSTAYQWGLVPLLAGLISLVTLRGTTKTRLLVLNGTIVLVLLGALIAGIRKHDSTVMVIPLAPIIAAVVCGTITGWFLLLQFGYKRLRARIHAT